MFMTKGHKVKINQFLVWKHGHVVAAVLSRAQLSDFMHFLCLRVYFVSQLLIILKYKFKTFDFTFEKCEL